MKRPATSPDVLPDPGPQVINGVLFVDIVHPLIEGSRASVPEHLVEHHAQRGWVLADSSAPADEEPPKAPVKGTASSSPQEDK